MSNLLIEIGTEELPVDSLQVVYAALRPKAEEIFSGNRLRFKKILVEATPRRIALFVESLAARQEDQSLEILGPSLEKAYDAEGRPTLALQGFLKSKNAAAKDVQTKETPKGKYVLIQKNETGKPAADILPLLLREIFTSLSFPKTMRWDKSGFRFARPIRWIAAILDRHILRFQLAEVKAGRESFGHRFLAPKSFALKRANWSEYQNSLKRAHVILSLDARRNFIRKALSGRFHQKKFDEDLVSIAAQLVEEPFILDGTFSKTYLDLPAEALASCMKKNQKIFACYDAKGHLTNRFVAVLNGRRKGLSIVRADYENVLESRLRDARYFYDADTQEPLEKKLPRLEQIVYLGKLGNMAQKTERMEKLAEQFAAFIGRNDLKADLKRTARLAKIDLMTHLVYEFPDLQGIVGREYALEAGEKEEVAGAIGTQYLPKNLAEDWRETAKQMTPLGALFGITDRMDLVVGAFGTGLEPSGSQDPYALRRAGGILVKLVHAFRFHFSLKELIEASASLYGNALAQSKEELTKRLLKFFEERVQFEIQTRPGMRAHEILLAVFRSSFDDLADVYDRYEILMRLYERDPKVLIKAAKIVERTANILKGIHVSAAINPDLFQEQSEKKLFRILQESSGEIEEFLKQRDYEKATARFGEIFYHPLHDFFEQVMVNAEDPAIRASRQALMKRIHGLYADRLADLSVLSRLDQE